MTFCLIPIFKNGFVSKIREMSNRLFIKKSANIGIGTTAPTERLHVEGNIVASGTIGPVSSRVFKKDIAYVSTKEAMDTLKIRDIFIS